MMPRQHQRRGHTTRASSQPRRDVCAHLRQVVRRLASGERVQVCSRCGSQLATLDDDETRAAPVEAS
jgi:hypothetical protein